MTTETISSPKPHSPRLVAIAAQLKGAGVPHTLRVVTRDDFDEDDNAAVGTYLICDKTLAERIVAATGSLKPTDAAFAAAVARAVSLGCAQ